MIVGHLAWVALGEPDGLRATLLGAILGLFLGIGTRRPSGALILFLMGALSYTFRNSINNFYYSSNLSMDPIVEYPILALSASLMGLILGMVWSFLNSEKTSSSRRQVED